MCIHVCRYVCMDVWMYACMCTYTYGRTDGRTDGWTDGRTDGWMDWRDWIGWMDGLEGLDWMDGWMNGWTCIEHTHIYIYTYVGRSHVKNPSPCLLCIKTGFMGICSFATQSLLRSGFILDTVL